MHYLLFGSLEPYGWTGGAEDYLGSYDTLEGAKADGIRQRLHEGHIAQFDGSRLTTVCELRWVERPVKDRDAYLKRKQRELDKANAVTADEFAGRGQWYWTPGVARLPTMRSWVDVG